MFVELRGVAQLGRALPSGGSGRRFKSSHPDQIINNLMGVSFRLLILSPFQRAQSDLY